MSAVFVAPNALVTIAANSALVRFLRGSILVSLVPIRSPFSTAAVIASSDQLPLGKSSKSDIDTEAFFAELDTAGSAAYVGTIIV